MDLKAIISILQGRFLIPTIVVVILLGGGIASVASEYKQMLKEKDILSTERKNFFDERVAFQKERADWTATQAIRQVELERREFQLRQGEQQANDRLSAMQQRANDFAVAENKLKTAAVAVSQAQKTREAEEKLERLMSEFSAIGVSLNDPTCNDAVAKNKYNLAKAKYNEAIALAKAYELDKKYSQFFDRNGQSHFGFCAK